jgi:hypothetical protein
VRTSSGTLFILTCFRGFRHLLQAHSRKVPRLGHGRFLPNPFQLTVANHLTIQRKLTSPSKIKTMWKEQRLNLEITKLSFTKNEYLSVQNQFSGNWV